MWMYDVGGYLDQGVGIGTVYSTPLISVPLTGDVEKGERRKTGEHSANGGNRRTPQFHVIAPTNLQPLQLWQAAQLAECPQRQGLAVGQMQAAQRSARCAVNEHIASKRPERATAHRQLTKLPQLRDVHHLN